MSSKESYLMSLNLDDVVQYFTYLDALRKSGLTNMYGASSYLMREFDFDKKTAHKVLGAWMNTFGKGRKAPRTRAQTALEKLGGEVKQ